MSSTWTVLGMDHHDSLGFVSCLIGGVLGVFLVVFIDWMAS